jgi:hypothetical protein
MKGKTIFHPLNCKTKIHPHFYSSGIYLYKTKRKTGMEFTFANNGHHICIIRKSLAFFADS